jgi:hypothetical protein
MAVLTGHLAEKIDLTLLWPDDAKHRYEAVLVKPGVEWNMTLNIKHQSLWIAQACFGNTGHGRKMYQGRSHLGQTVFSGFWSALSRSSTR